MTLRCSWRAGLLLLLLAATVALAGCDAGPARSFSGVKKADVKIAVDPSTGLTIEQNTVSKRLLRDNQPGNLLHLYVLNPLTGDVIAYSTVDGKVSSSGKRLTATMLPEEVFSGKAKRRQGFGVTFGGNIKDSAEVLQDDGTYGSSIWYIYWFDKNDRYHQHFPSDDQIVHVTDVPLPAARTTLALDFDNMKAQAR